MFHNMRRAFGVRSDWSIGMFGLELQQLGLAERLVDDADAGPQQHLTARLSRKIPAEVTIRPEDDLLVLGDLVEDHLRAAARDDDV